MPVFQSRPLPKGLETLTELALDLRWTWSHGADALWLSFAKNQQTAGSTKNGH